MKANLLLVIHFHQPVGNFDNVIQRVHDRCYKPFLDLLAEFPDIKVNIHISGCLLDWFESHEPGILATIGKLVKRKQVEMVGGGYYEPILSIIPPQDRAGQIEMMKEFVKSRFGQDVKSAWIAERIWEPGMPSSLADSGVKYIVLDDTHFIYSGMKKQDLYGYFISEDNGKSVYIFPSDKTLRYKIPFSDPNEPVSHMRQTAENTDGAIFTYGDDVEKFGEWPGTYKWVYEDNWLVRFLTILSENKNWLTTLKFSECVKEIRPLGRAYLPTASYEEMLEWALPADAGSALEELKEEIKREGRYDRYAPFIRGGFFRNFFAKYDEINQMHKRMLYVSSLVERSPKSASPSKLAEAKRELYMGQCNCSYWHGVFGGVYLYHLRRAVYEHLLKSEQICASEIEKKDSKAVKHEVFDFDVDGYDEAILQNNRLWVCAKPSAGGTVVEVDLKDKFVNMLNILTRREEAYHKKIAQKVEKEAGEGEHISIHDKPKTAEDLASKLIYDGYKKAMFVDHFFGEDTTLEDFELCKYMEEGDFINALYDFKVVEGKKDITLVMERRGSAHGTAIKLQKEISIAGSSMRVKYIIMNEGRGKKEFWFGTEMAFIMPNADSPQYAYRFDGDKKGLPIDSKAEVLGLKQLIIADDAKECGLTLDLSKKCGLWMYPIKTISQSEKAYEENYQGSVITPYWRLVIGSKEKAEISLDICYNS